MTQTYERPKDASPLAGTDVRPEKKGEFCRVLYSRINANELVVALLHYKDVVKFGGLKLMVFHEYAWNKLNKKSIDPHFYNDEQSPVMRVIPDEGGIKLLEQSGIVDQAGSLVLQELIRNWLS